MCTSFFVLIRVCETHENEREEENVRWREKVGKKEEKRISGKKQSLYVFPQPSICRFLPVVSVFCVYIRETDPGSDLCEGG